MRLMLPSAKRLQPAHLISPLFSARRATEVFFITLQGRLRKVSVRWSAAAGLAFGASIEINVPLIGSGTGVST
jgi:hypothetical protein